VTAAAERAQLAAIGGDLARLAAGPGWRRARALLGPIREEPLSFADLARAPAWLRRSRDDLAALARSAALIALGPAIAASIDGGWLGELANSAGEESLDRAIALAPRAPEGGLPPLPADAVEGLGFGLMRAALPPALRRYLAWAPAGSIEPTQALARFCVGEAARG
jgi:hypothetical protein